MNNPVGISKLIGIAKRKNIIDSNYDWSDGSSTYIDELRKELIEVEEEIPLNRVCYLEDELGDILWDYLNILVCLEKEKDIKINNVIQRALLKYNERVSGIENNIPWQVTKSKQKKRMSREYQKNRQ